MQNKSPNKIDLQKAQKQLSQQKNLHVNNPKEFAQMMAQKYIKHSPEPQKMKSLANDFHLPQLIPNHYCYFLGQGNNHKVVQRVMQPRSEWVQVSNYTDINVQFKWQQTNKGYQYERLNWSNKSKIALNHFEFHIEISQKDYLFKNLQSYCEDNQLNVFDIVPITFVFDFSSQLADQQLLNFLIYYEKHAPDHIQLKQDQYRKFFFIRRVLAVTITSGDGGKQIQTPIPKVYQSNDYLWMLKTTQFNRGRGIHVFGDLDQMTKLMDEYIQGRTTKSNEILKSKTFVIQKYLERPLLIKNRKFDIRVWFMLTQELELYFFSQGYIRLASEEYNLKNIGNSFVHLTNNAIQKHSNKYGQLEDGNQMSFDDTMKYFAHKGDFYKNIVDKIKKLGYIAFSSVRRKINIHNRKFCFEIFGLDFMIDEDFKVWLIEVNTNPCLEESSPLLAMLIPRMLDDAFQLTIDVEFPVADYKVKYPVTNYNDHHNMWQNLGKLSSKATL
ncbi:hypothetical protein pb186bvf_000120 [Paramecium bursaria]